MISIERAPSPLAWSRILLVVIGASLMLFGVLWAGAEIRSDQFAIVGLWLVGAIVVADGVIAPLIVAFGMMGRRTARRIGEPATRVARAALVTAACCSLVTIPGIAVRAVGPRNPSIHSVDYVLVLGALWVIAIIVASSAAIIGRQRAGVRARTK